MPLGWWAEVFARTKTSLQPLSSSIDGGTIELASIGAALQKLQSGSSGSVPEAGPIATSLLGLQTAMAGGIPPQGGIASSLWTPASSMAGGTGDLASIATILGAVSSAINGGQTDPGAIAATLAKATTALSGGQIQSGSIATALKKAISTIAGNVPVSIARDSVSTGATTGFAAGLSWTQTPVATCTMYAIAAASPYPIIGATCGPSGSPAAMTQVASAAGPSGYLSIWKLDGVAGGVAQTISVSTAGVGNQSGITGFSVAYTGVNSTGTALTGSGSGTGATQSVTLGSGARILQAFGAYNGGTSGASFVSPTGGNHLYSGADGNRSGLCVSDATATTTFAATGTPSYYSGWSAAALILS